MTALATRNVLLNGEPQAVPASATAQVISNVFEIAEEDTLNFAFQVTVVSVTGTAGYVLVQHSLDGTNFVNADGTNQKITISSGAGNYQLSVGQTNSTYNAKLPMFRYLRFVATTTSSDHWTVTNLLFQGVKQTQ
jgi:hypothetical protein